PGESLARASALPRLPRGSWFNVVEARVLATNCDVVSSVCDSPAVISTVSDVAPSSRLTRTSVVWLVETETLLSVSDLNPGAVTVISYKPTARSGNRNVPTSVEVISRVMPVFESFKTTVALGTTAPDGS